MVWLSSLLFFSKYDNGEMIMRSYTLDEARNIVMRCAKQYERNLLGRSFLVIYRDRVDNLIKELEIYFGEDNYQHLTGIELIDNDGKVREHVASLFFDKCLKNALKKDEFQFKSDGTTNLKLAALPVIMQIHKVTKIAGNYNGVRPYLVADKLVGNVNFCLGLKKDWKQGGYVPASSLLEDIKVLTDVQSQVLAIFSKEKEEVVYERIRHVAKGINLNNITLPENIRSKISLGKYEPKEIKKKAS